MVWVMDMAYNNRMKKLWILWVGFCLMQCKTPDFFQIVDKKIGFMTDIRKKEGKQYLSGKIDTSLLCNGLFFRTFHEPIPGTADPVTAKIIYVSSRLFYRFEKPNEQGIGRVWISNRFTDADFQQYYEKGRGLDFDIMANDKANTYLKMYEIDENDGLINIYTDNLSDGRKKFYGYLGKQCKTLTFNETVSRNYWLAEVMSYQMETVEKENKANPADNRHVELRKISGKYPNSTDIFTDKPMTLVRMGKTQAENHIVSELAAYERDASFKTTDNICPFRWEAIRGLSVDSLIARKVISKEDTTFFNPVLVKSEKEEVGWIFGGSTTTDSLHWINQRIPRELKDLKKKQVEVKRQNQGKELLFDSLDIDFPTIVREYPPNFQQEISPLKGTIVNIFLPENRFGILDMHWSSGLNKERLVLWLKVKKLKKKT